jgi:hypothetical protein
MLQVDREFLRRRSSQKLRTTLVVWLSVGFSLTSLIFAYTFYMRYRDQGAQGFSPADREGVASLLRSNGNECAQVCAIDRDEIGKGTTVACGTAPAPNVCARTVRYSLSIAPLARQR